MRVQSYAFYFIFNEIGRVFCIRINYFLQIQSITTVVQPCLSSTVPYCMPRRVL